MRDTTLVDSATPELLALDQIVVAAKAKVAAARDLADRKTAAQAALDHARRSLIEAPSPTTADAFAEAMGFFQTSGDVAQALEEAGATNEKSTVQAMLSSERGYSLFSAAWAKRLASLESIQKSLLRRLADARQTVTMTGVIHPLAVESSRPVVEIRAELTTVENLAAESRFSVSFCETQGAGREPQSLFDMLEALRRPLPTE